VTLRYVRLGQVRDADMTVMSCVVWQVCASVRMMVMGFPRKRTLPDNLRGVAIWFGLCVAGVGLRAQVVAAGLPSGSAAGGTITLREAGIGRSRRTARMRWRWRMLGLRKSQSAIALAGLLPGVVYHNQYLYTQGQPHASATPSSSGATTGGIRFIANNTVHEYVSQGVVTENLGGQGIVDYRKSLADGSGCEGEA